MRLAVLSASFGLLLSSAAIAVDAPAVPEVQLIPQDNANPGLTVKTPSPGATANLVPGGPILQSVTLRTNVRGGRGNVIDVVPDFHFVAPNGNAIIIHRELVDTSGAISQTDIPDATIRIPAAAQKKGAVQSGGWTCGKNQYYVTIRAFIMDAEGNRSNPVEYTIHCNGG